MAVLEFLTAAARTRLVATRFGSGSHRMLGCLRHRRRSLPSTRGKTRRSALGLLFIAHGAELCQRGSLGVLRLQRAIEPGATLLFLAFDLLRALHLYVERREDGDSVELDALEHRGEQL